MIMVVMNPTTVRGVRVPLEEGEDDILQGFSGFPAKLCSRKSAKYEEQQVQFVACFLALFVAEHKTPVATENDRGPTGPRERSILIMYFSQKMLSYPDTYIIFIGKVRHTRKIGYRKHSSYEIIEDSRTYCPSVKKGLELA